MTTINAILCIRPTPFACEIIHRKLHFRKAIGAPAEQSLIIERRIRRKLLLRCHLA